MEKIISFPHLANYHIPVEFLLKNVFTNAKILVAPPITKKTIEVGAKHSPDFVCSPFKYNLGNFIESLERGANILIQAGGGCRFSFYGHLQEQILRDLGYKFTFINLFDAKGISLKKLLKTIKEINGKINLKRLVYYFFLTKKMVLVMDKLDMYMRENIGFEKNNGEFLAVQEQFFTALKKIKNYRQLKKISKIFSIKYREIELIKPDSILKIGLIGELYNLMEPFANYFLERELAKNNILISRYINADFLLFKKKKNERRILKDAEGYLKYHIGADGTTSVSTSINLAKRGYDGLIHIKPFGCTPEVNAIPALINVASNYKIPIIYFSFDSQTSEEGVKTRLEAFYDMLKMKKGRGINTNA